MSYHNSSEVFNLQRDCEAIMVPSGEVVTLPAGQNGYITQALGGSFTVFIDGNLFRISNHNADALGKQPMPTPQISENASQQDVEKTVWEQLRTCFDPEIPVNIVDLGLVYHCKVESLQNQQYKVYIEMTLTAPGCGMGDVLVEDVRSKVELIPCITEADVELVFEPAWDREMMSESAKLETGVW